MHFTHSFNRHDHSVTTNTPPRYLKRIQCELKQEAAKHFMKMWFVIHTFRTKFRGKVYCGQFLDIKCNHTFNSTQELIQALIIHNYIFFFAIEIRSARKKAGLEFFWQL